MYIRIFRKFHSNSVLFSLQSDIVHQSVYELVHSEDREELQRQLMWNSFLPAESASLPLHDALSPQHSHLLERSFTVRFRCLLDNTSGFLVSSPFDLKTGRTSNIPYQCGTLELFPPKIQSIIE